MRRCCQCYAGQLHRMRRLRGGIRARGCGGTSAGRCEDINECSSTPGLTPIDGSNNCDSNARCFNLNNTFECACNAGFYGNGTICKYVLSHTHTHTNSRAFVHALSHWQGC